MMKPPKTGPGVHINATPIWMDNFPSSAPPGSLFFLSHVHTDHLVGLGPNWSRGTIYCSQFSRKYLVENLKVKSKFVVALAVNESVEIPLIPDKSVQVKVTPLDAHHCVGSYMYVFEGYWGCVLCTGDCRVTDAMLMDVELQKFANRICKVFLDNTNCFPSMFYPSQDIVLKEIVANVSNSLSDSTRHVYIALDKIGKEEIISALLNEIPYLKVISSEERIWTFGNVPGIDTDGLVIDNFGNEYSDEVKENEDVEAELPDSPFIFVISNRSLSMRHLRRYVKRARSCGGSAEEGISLVIPTSRDAFSDEFSRRIASSEIGEFVSFAQFPYSSHSSFAELQSLISLLRPQSIIPILTNHSEKGISELHKLCVGRVDDNPVVVPKLLQEWTDLMIERQLITEQLNFQSVDTNSSSYGGGGTESIDDLMPAGSSLPSSLPSPSSRKEKLVESTEAIDLSCDDDDDRIDIGMMDESNEMPSIEEIISFDNRKEEIGESRGSISSSIETVNPNLTSSRSDEEEVFSAPILKRTVEQGRRGIEVDDEDEIAGVKGESRRRTGGGGREEEQEDILVDEEPSVAMLEAMLSEGVRDPDIVSNSNSQEEEIDDEATPSVESIEPIETIELSSGLFPSHSPSSQVEKRRKNVVPNPKRRVLASDAENSKNKRSRQSQTQSHSTTPRSTVVARRKGSKAFPNLKNDPHFVTPSAQAEFDFICEVALLDASMNEVD